MIMYDKFNTEEYFDSVFYIALGGFTKVHLTESDLERYHRRIRTNWTGVDSLHDALLLIEKIPRHCFDMAAFTRKYSTWNLLHKER